MMETLVRKIPIDEFILSDDDLEKADNRFDNHARVSVDLLYGRISARLWDNLQRRLYERLNNTVKPVGDC
jgi:hypothetical protein